MFFYQKGRGVEAGEARAAEAAGVVGVEERGSVGVGVDGYEAAAPPTRAAPGESHAQDQLLHEAGGQYVREDRRPPGQAREPRRCEPFAQGGKRQSQVESLRIRDKARREGERQGKPGARLRAT